MLIFSITLIVKTNLMIRWKVGGLLLYTSLLLTYATYPLFTHIQLVYLMIVTVSHFYYFVKQKLYFIFKVNPLDAASIKVQSVLKISL